MLNKLNDYNVKLYIYNLNGMKLYKWINENESNIYC